MKIDIRTARPEDAAAACALLRQSIVQCCAEDHRHDEAVLDSWLANKTPETVTSWIASPSNHCLLAFVDDLPAGVAILTRKGKIGLLHIHPDRLFLGVGKTLLNALEAQAKAWGLASLQVNSTQSAHRFYVSHGYIDGVRVKAAYGIDAISLIKRLVPSYARRPGCPCAPVISFNGPHSRASPTSDGS
jgi:GNAT superfamily N-acetyltransferase